MRTILMKYIGAIVIMAALTSTFCQDSPDAGQITYRPATVAGAFYPENIDSLKNSINEYLLPDEPKLIKGDIIGLVVPHAGYVFSGWVAGKAYRELEGKKYDDIIIISPSHTKAFQGSSVFKGEGYTTPLGVAGVDLELAKEIADGKSSYVKYSLDGHEWQGGRTEHAIEVQVPFLQVVQPNTPIIPIIMGSQDFPTVDALVKSIVKAVRKLRKKVLIVASSDLSHFHNQRTAESIDTPFVRAFSKFDYFKMEMNLFSDRWEACGGGPIIATMMIAEQLGANSTYPFLYATSANSPFISADSSRVVGYCSGAIYNDMSGKLNILPNLNEDDKKFIMDVAKKSVKAAVTNTEVELKDKVNSELNDEYAAFVTLKEDGILRGCMGQTFTTSSLLNAVVEAGRLAATRDPRFKPVSKIELDKLEYEVTILSRFKKILSDKEIEIGRDGVYLRLGNSAALFLPQVAPEQHWNTEELLENLCSKARLPLDAYKSPDAELFIFQAMIID